jgi:hypothetical protein
MTKADEELVFQSIRLALEAYGWSMIAGQAARGSTDLPVVQARLGSMKGSKGALKPDLVASKDGFLLVLELKPSFSIADVEKCGELAGSQPLIDSLLVDLSSRRKWPCDNSGQPVRPRHFLTGVAYQGEARQLERSVCFALSVSEHRWSICLPRAPMLSADLVTSLSI